MYKFLSVVLSVFVLAGCVPQQEVTTRVVPVDQPQRMSEQGFLYALPMTTLALKVQVTRVTYKKGPYSMFAAQMLDLDEVIDRDREIWTLDNVTADAFSEPDPGYNYQVISTDRLLPTAFRLTERGFLLQLNPYACNGLPEAKMPQVSPVDAIVFPYRNLKGPTEEIRDTAYKTILRDTSFIQMPVLVTREHSLSLEEKAAEAAETIIKLRKRKFRIISRNNAEVALPDGPGLATAIKEIDKMQQDYLALFIGKTIRQTYTYNFLLTPSDTLDNPLVLFRFLSALGVLPSSDLRGDPVTVRWTARENPGIITNDSIMKTLPSIPYRIPEISEVQIDFGQRVLFSKNILLYQSGSLTTIPGNIIFQPEVPEP